MSAQAYLDTVERNTGLTPRALVQCALDHGFSAGSKATQIGSWFTSEYGLGHGHAMTFAQVVRNLDSIDIRNADTTPEPPGSIGRLWLDGIDSRPF